MSIKNPEPVYGYIRVSSGKQLDGDGPERQTKAIDDHATVYSLDVREFFTDAQKGKNELRDRPEMYRMFELCKQSGIKKVIVEGPMRLSRDNLVNGTIVAQFRLAGIKIISAQGNFDLTAGKDDPLSKAINQIMAVISELEKDMLVQKMRFARERIKARTGKCEGMISYGHMPKRPTNSHRARARMERDRIGIMFDLKAQGKTYFQIARYLNEHDMHPRRGREWRLQGIRWIMERVERERAKRVPVSLPEAAEVMAVAPVVVVESPVVLLPPDHVKINPDAPPAGFMMLPNAHPELNGETL